MINAFWQKYVDVYDFKLCIYSSKENKKISEQRDCALKQNKKIEKQNIQLQRRSFHSCFPLLKEKKCSRVVDNLFYFQQSDPLSRPLIPERSKWALWQVLREMKIKCPPLPPNMKIANFVGNTRALKPRFLIVPKTCISLFLLLWDLKLIRLNTHQLNSNKIQS